MPRRFATLLLLAVPAFALSLEGAARKDILATEKVLYSTGREELIIRDFFQDRPNGFFLDVGCSHPIKASNTYYLEKHLGWSGIAVDALPELAKKWRANRPTSRFFNYLVTDHADTTEDFYRAQPGLKDISSVERPMTGPAGKPIQAEKIRVPSITLDKLLEQSGVSAIDFLTLDIEGHEPKALAGFDIERFQPRLACVEAKPANRQKILDYFAAHGYERIERYQKHDKSNYYFAPRAPR